MNPHGLNLAMPGARFPDSLASAREETLALRDLVLRVGLRRVAIS